MSERMAIVGMISKLPKSVESFLRFCNPEQLLNTWYPGLQMLSVFLVFVYSEI